MSRGRSANGPGTMPAARATLPVLDIKAIYHRNDPILLGVPPMGGGTGRDGALPRGDALGHDQAEHRPTPACPACRPVWCHEVGGARMLHGSRDHAALSRPRRAGGAHRRAMRRLGLCLEICRRGRRRRRRDQPRPSAVGDAHAHRSQGVDPVHQRLMGFAAPIRALPPERRAAGDMTHSVAHHQRLQAVALARQVSRRPIRRAPR